MTDLKKLQKEIYQNKVNKGFNITDINKEFCLTYGEVAEAYEAWRKKKDDLAEELADVAIYLLGLSEILNIDLEDFFDSFNFGRVRGFFIKDRNFCVSSDVATVIAQIACYKGKLPQRAPSTPIITNLIARILD